MSTFYDYLNSQNKRDAVSMDAMPNGYKHPDGTPCRAKSPKTCPFFKEEEHEAVKIDDLDPVARVQTETTEEEFAGISKGEDPGSPNVRPVEPSELDTLTEGSTNSKYRKMRNEAFDALQKRKAAGENVDGTYPLSDPTHKVQHKGADGEMHDGFADGFQVSFQTTNGEGFNRKSGKRMSDEDYDRTVDEIAKETGSEPYLGVFGAIPEVSFRCDTLEKAMEIAKKYNQVSIADNARIAADIWDSYTFPANPDYDWRENQTFVMK